MLPKEIRAKGEELIRNGVAFTAIAQELTKEFGRAVSPQVVRSWSYRIEQQRQAAGGIAAIDIAELVWSVVPYFRADLDLPAAPGVYVAANDSGALYVGQARCMRSRWSKGHHRALELVRNDTKQLYYSVTDRYDEAEAAVIYYYRQQGVKLLNAGG